MIRAKLLKLLQMSKEREQNMCEERGVKYRVALTLRDHDTPKPALGWLSLPSSLCVLPSWASLHVIHRQWSLKCSVTIRASAHSTRNSITASKLSRNPALRLFLLVLAPFPRPLPLFLPPSSPFLSWDAFSRMGLVNSRFLSSSSGGITSSSSIVCVFYET